MRFFVGAAVILLQPVAVAFTAASYTPRATNQYNIYNIDYSITNGCLCSHGSKMSSSDVFHSNKAADQIEEEHRSKRGSFESPKIRVYIEDTDAYGVMYNSNYVRTYERALLRYAPLHNGSADQTENNVHEKWILSSVHSQKFRSSPALGEEYIIRGELFECDVDVQTWDLEMVTEDIIHNSARVTIISAGMKVSVSNNLNLNGKIDEKRYTSYHDEFNHYKFNSNDHIHNYYVPLRNAMNFFERSRSDFLGGPNALRKMQIDDDLIWVVTGVENGQLFLGIDDNASLMDDVPVDNFLPEKEMQKVRHSISDNESVVKICPGKDVIVQTSFDVKRRGMILDCHHTLWMKDGNTSKRLAQATCIIVALKGSTRRPTSKLPQWVLDKFAS